MTLQKTESFQPLTSASAANKNREFRVTVIPQAEPAPPFKHLGQAGETQPGNPNKNCEPRLSLEHDDGKISNIRIQCSCGQVMELACLYDEPVKTK
ncbi:MAG TPA: hypothetical protein VNX46_12980 [Candidatus Acidoferrum sp.]|nr:hypothetical protein [Candidatus Acidoferrum sp.]